MNMYDDMKCCSEPKAEPTFADVLKDNHGYLVELEKTVDDLARNLFGVETTEKEPNAPQDMLTAFALDANTTMRILSKVSELHRKICG